MEKINLPACQPIFFERNRVYRIYLGGKSFGAFFAGDKGEDNYFPEEWIASNVKAINPRYFGERDGVSVIEGSSIFFDDLIRDNSDLVLGSRRYDCLVKLLDSAIRLPIQVHPTKNFSRKYFNSDYGKTEAWLVVATRENARIYFGFKNKISKDEFSELVERSEKEKDIMTSTVSYVDAKVGDVYLIKAGLVHAIGAGCTILEVQEPTDFTIQPENWCGTYHISDNEKYIGLSKNDALDCFNYDMCGQTAIDAARIIPKIAIDSPAYRKEILISYEDTPCFSEYRHILKGGSFVMDYAPSVWIVLEGEAEIRGIKYTRKIKKGDYFFLPYVAENRFSIHAEKATLCECRPSEQK
ncbi:MAG: mannose-6-phosphate isomerase [Clostridia bacterium]|nr:mannose-6-phosphate isomerase [Clostridia bacterium]